MLVTRVLGDCPECGGKGRFGNVSVRGDHVLRGCMSCRYRTTIWLPSLRKKILYLDQFFFSNAFKEHDPRFTKAAQRIREISALQLLSVPFSSIHEDETHQWRGYDGKNKEDLMEFIKATSRGHEFEPSYDVEQTQIVRAFQAYLQGKTPTFELQQRDAVPSDIHEWDDYLRIDVGRYINDIEFIRVLKRQGVEMLIEAFPAWRQSTSTFEQDVTIELREAAKNYFDAYLKYAARISIGDYSAFLDSPIMATVVQTMLQCLPQDSEPKESLKKISEFFKSEYFSEIPYQWLSVRVFAILKDMVKQGAYPNRENALQRLSGFFQDMKHVSIYAPYCDAFVMDKAMAALVDDPRIALEERYGVKVFSLNNWNEFLAWLDTLESGMSQEHQAGLAAAYP
jgi:hypothetical protein